MADGVEKLTSIGDRLNRIKENTFTGIDRIGGRFSCSVSECDDWNGHARAMAEYLDLFKDILIEAQGLGIELNFDVAIEPEDYEKRIYVSTCLELELLRKLVDGNVGVNFSYYSPSKDQKLGDDKL